MRGGGMFWVQTCPLSPVPATHPRTRYSLFAAWPPNPWPPSTLSHAIIWSNNTGMTEKETVSPASVSLERLVFYRNVLQLWIKFEEILQKILPRLWTFPSKTSASVCVFSFWHFTCARLSAVPVAYYLRQATHLRDVKRCVVSFSAIMDHIWLNLMRFTKSRFSMLTGPLKKI